MRYDSYKDSGVEWLGEVPEHWEVKKFKTIFHEINEKSLTGTETLLSVSQFTGVTQKKDNIQEGELITNAESLEGYKIVKQGDLVSNIMLAWNGSLGFSDFNGIASPAYCVYRIKSLDNRKFLHYLVRSECYKAEFKRRSSGIVDSRLRLYTENFFNIYGISPPLSEQTVIAQYLDDKTAKIDRAIALEQQQIELLKERKQIVIQTAVTRGLNPDVAFKDSGVEWLGEVPEHWEVKKIKTFSKINNGLDYKSVMAEEGYPVFGSGGQFAYAKTYLYDGEAILLGRKGTIDKPLYINDKFWTVDTMFYCVCNHQVYAKFIYYCCCSVIPFQYYSTSTALPSMTQSDILNHKITLPPLSEQTAIAHYLDEQTYKIDRAISIKLAQIDKLKEYKTVLINEVVTGKRRVVQN